MLVSVTWTNYCSSLTALDSQTKFEVELSDAKMAVWWYVVIFEWRLSYVRLSHARPAPRTAHAVHKARRNDWVQHRCVASRLLQLTVVWRAVDVTRQTATLSKHAGPCCDAEHQQDQLQSLHWLPIRERIRQKVATLTFKAHWMSSPPYYKFAGNRCWTITSRHGRSDLPARRA